MDGKTNVAPILKAVIHVTTKPGATVTFTKGGISASVTANGSGVADFEVLSFNWGSWTVTSTSSIASNSQTITVSAATTYNVSLSLRLWLVKDGDFASGATHSFSSEHTSSGSFYDSGNDILLRQKADHFGYSDAIVGYFNSISFDGYWKTLVMQTKEKGKSVTGKTLIGGLTSGSGTNPTFAYMVQLRSAGQYSSVQSDYHTSTLNVSGARGTYSVAFRGCMYDYEDFEHGIVAVDGDIRIRNLYLDP